MIGACQYPRHLTGAMVLLMAGCTTYPTCPLPLEASSGYVRWDKEAGILEADKGGRDMFENYIAARRVCGAAALHREKN